MSAIDLACSPGPPLVTRKPWLASKYGSLKSMTLARSGVIVISLMATSKFFGAGENRPENGVLTHLTFAAPSSWASALAKSTSKPLGLSIGSSRKPATGNSAPAVS